MSIWDTIEGVIRQSGFPEFSLVSKREVSGGDISRSYRISDLKKHFFVKLNSLEFIDNFQQEVIGLKFLSSCKKFVVPKVVAVDSHVNQSFLVLEYFQLNNFGDAGKFAQALASLHKISNNNFGFESDNYIGANPQKNCRSNDWGKFFVENRLLIQFELLLQKNPSPSEINLLESNFSSLMLRCLDFLNLHSPIPSLVHGDLWQGNYAFSHDGEPVIFDPACYFADREVDIAMLELFGSPSQEFYDSYYQLLPRQKGEKVRKKIYNLYHLLNHANLFGQGYYRQVNTNINELQKLI